MAAAAVIVAAWLAWWHARTRRRLTVLERGKQEAVRQLDRRITEIFSLQEISYILSASLQLDALVAQVTRFTERFLRADGVLLALEGDRGLPLRVVAAEGLLARLLGRELTEANAPVVLQAIGRERVEVADALTHPGLAVDDVPAGALAVAPLQAHGVTFGALVALHRRDAAFGTEDIWLLSTVAMQTAVVAANSRFVDLIQRGKDEWETLFHALTEGIAVVGPDGRIERANRSLARFAGRPGAELIGQDLGAILPGSAEPLRELLAATQRGEAPGPAIQAIAGGRTVRLTTSPVMGPGARAAAVVLVEDVTEQRALEAQLIQNEKLAAVGQLVSGVAHELNNPLTSIAGLSELLLEQGAMTGDARQHLEVIHQQADRAGRIVRNLLTFARKGEPERRRIDVNDLVTRTTRLVAHDVHRRGIELETALLPGSGTVLGDVHELQQVLLNLLTNAIHVLAQLPSDAAPRVTVSTARTSRGIDISVRDTGPGIPPELRGQLFTPFFTTKGPDQGTGLGLSISYGIVKSHGGGLVCVPAADRGAEFVVTLPEAGAAEPGAEEPPHPATDPPPTRRLLLVDDDPAAHRLVAAVFAGRAELTWARTADQGLALAATGEFDLILADARTALPDGTTFAIALARASPVAVSRLILATRDETELPLLPDGSIVAALPRPFSPRDLRDLVTALLEPG